jgi:ATP sulfurylase
MNNNTATTTQQKEENFTFHKYYGTKIPIALRIEDYGTPKKSEGDTTIVELKDITLVITKIFEDVYSIKFYKDKKLVYEFKDIFHNSYVIRIIYGILVVMKDNTVILNKTHPKYYYKKQDTIIKGDE